MTSNIPSLCCMRGSMHDGSTTGTEETIHGLSAYVALPETQTYKGTVVIVPDVFGWNFINFRLLADSYAKRAGIRVLIPDFQFGDSFPQEHLDSAFPMKGREGPFLIRTLNFISLIPRFMLWFFTHRQARTLPIITAFFKALQEEQHAIGNKVGSAGFCWGGRYAILMGPYVDAIYAAHPSLLSIPSEIEAIATPVSFALGEKDTVVPLSQVEIIKGVLKKKESLDSEVIVYENMPHSFAVRANPQIEEDKKGLEGSETQAVEWFIKHLT